MTTLLQRKLLAKYHPGCRLFHNLAPNAENDLSFTRSLHFWIWKFYAEEKLNAYYMFEHQMKEQKADEYSKV